VAAIHVAGVRGDPCGALHHKNNSFCKKIPTICSSPLRRAVRLATLHLFGVRIGTFGSMVDCGLTSTVYLPGDDFSSVWERSEEIGKKNFFSKSEEEAARCKKKQDGYRLKGDREKDLFGFC